MPALVLSLEDRKISKYLTIQINNIFPDEDIVSEEQIHSIVIEALSKIEYCFKSIKLPYYKKDGLPYFNHLHGDHYSSFLYWTSRIAYLKGFEPIASKLFFLNKMLFGIDAFYGIELPSRFIFVHPIGTILGRGKYAEYFVTYQGVTIGANADSVYPEFSEKTILFSHASLIGSTKTGANLIVGANASLINSIVNDNSVVVGNYPNHKVLENKSNQIYKYFDF